MNEEARRGMDILTAPPQRSRDPHMCRGHAGLSVHADSRLAFGCLNDVRQEAVSYTHLDVYKRQVLTRLILRFLGWLWGPVPTGWSRPTGQASHSAADPPSPLGYRAAAPRGAPVRWKQLRPPAPSPDIAAPDPRPCIGSHRVVRIRAARAPEWRCSRGHSTGQADAACQRSAAAAAQPES